MGGCGSVMATLSSLSVSAARSVYTEAAETCPVGGGGWPRPSVMLTSCLPKPAMACFSLCSRPDSADFSKIFYITGAVIAQSV